MKSVARIAIVVISLVSCSSGAEKVAPIETSTSITSATTEQTTTTEPATTTTAPPTPGEVYLALVAPLNCQDFLFGVTEDEVYGEDNRLTSRDWPAIQEKLLPAWQAESTASVTFLQGLAAYTWPTSVQPQIDALLAEMSADASFYQTVADAKTYDQFAASTNKDRVPSVAAAAVRAKLGIPSNINSDVDECAKVFTQ